MTDISDEDLTTADMLGRRDGRKDAERHDPSGSDRLAERIIGGIECEFRDWLSPDEYAQAKRIIKQIIESEYQTISLP